MKKAVFIHKLGATSASYRYRAQVPARHIGCEINQGEAEIVVFSKPIAQDFPILEQAKGKCAIIVDFCDDHFHHPKLGAVYERFLKEADQLVCPTKTMQENILMHPKYGGQPVSIIEDPYEFEEMEPHADGEKYLWFGHKQWLSDTDRIKNFKNLTIVTGPGQVEGAIEYSPESLRQAMTENNIALFPKSLPYKSPNRLLNALRMGLFPVCDWHPAYVEFKDFCWVADVYSGRKWAKHFQADLNDLVREGQDYIRDRYSPETIGEKWKSLLGSI